MPPLAGLDNIVIFVKVAAPQIPVFSVYPGPVECFFTGVGGVGQPAVAAGLAIS